MAWDGAALGRGHFGVQTVPEDDVSREDGDERSDIDGRPTRLRRMMRRMEGASARKIFISLKLSEAPASLRRVHLAIWVPVGKKCSSSRRTLRSSQEK